MCCYFYHNCKMSPLEKNNLITKATEVLHLQQTSDFFKVSFRVARVQLIFVIAAAIDQRIKQDNSVEIRKVS